jgi:hypothetical protein
MEAQISLTVSESKRFIAKAVASLPEVREALKNGKVILKGGTTVSALCEEMVGMPLRISGRITPRGTVTAKDLSREHPHSVLIEKGTVSNIDDTIAEVAQGLGRKDIVIISGNAMDTSGNVAMMAGSPGGGNPGSAISGMLAQGARIIIPMGLEKLILGSIQDAVKAAGRDKDLSYGMAVGLIPLIGKVVTEKDAAEILSHVRCTVIGRGGINEAEGSTVMVVEGEEREVERLLRIVDAIKGAGISGEETSMEECDGRSIRCRDHTSCIYREGKRR